MPAKDLTTLLDDPGFTPGVRHLAPLLDALVAADRKQAARIERALARAGAAAARVVLERLAAADPRGRARLVALLGRAAGAPPDPQVTAALLCALDDADEQVRRAAVRALARARVPECEAPLVAAWPAASAATRRALADALGKLGGDPELRRLVARAVLMLERSAQRDVQARIALDAPLPFAARVLLRCRAGLEELLAGELAALATPIAAEQVAPGAVAIAHAGDLAALLEARLVSEVLLELPLQAAEDAQVVDALAGDPARALLRAWTAGQPRFRLAWAQGGAQRARTWRVAQEVARRAPGLVNDPAAAPWEVTVDEGPPPRLLLRPRFDDPRFAYRRRDVPAASHPTIAAALARALGAREDDVVWDPFAGSGLELIERARLGPYRELHGTDRDAQALKAAGENLRAAGVEVTALRKADARTHRVPGLSAVLTNPPMGRRVARDGSLGALLGAFLDNAAAQLVSGGRLVWLSPLPPKTAARGRALGLRVKRGPAVDLGGFSAELQTMRKP